MTNAECILCFEMQNLKTCHLKLFCVSLSLGVLLLRRAGVGAFTCLCPMGHCLIIRPCLPVALYFVLKILIHLSVTDQRSNS